MDKLLNLWCYHVQTFSKLFWKGISDTVHLNRKPRKGTTVKFHLAEWYRVSTGEKRMKVTAPRIKLAYNNVNPKETNGSGIPGLLEFVGGAAAAASPAQEEAAPAAEAVADRAKILKHNRIKGRAFEQR